MRSLSWPRKVFLIVNYMFLIALGLVCVLPIVHLLAVSLSSAGAASAGHVSVWPVDFNLESYKVVLEKGQFMRSFFISVERLVLGTSLSILLCILTAYPLSKEKHRFPGRTVYVWFFVFTILFNGGLIPSYLVVKQTGLLDTIWALVVPGAVNVFNIVLLLNFFRGLPKELEESARVDGANQWTVLWRIYLPLSLPALATITLFTMVGHWNSWFDGLLYMKNPADYPLATYLQSITVTVDDLRNMQLESQATANVVSDQTGRAAQIFMTALPILLVYPFLQKYFVKGLVLGSVKE
ncbi:carbohydrate ABC transporter permease [Numidum massiliense]|uniref:carbohydrate ABC transporter permease n=1 Tax=Numidum massiliense TaxID=1522315 RepID=UPI0006D55B16|nr:carbohydrate ABC transporter permease [Numidum massiliense]